MEARDFGTVKDGSGTMNIQRTRARVIAGAAKAKERARARANN